MSKWRFHFSMLDSSQWCWSGDHVEEQGIMKVFAMISVVSLHNSISLLPCFLVYSKVKLACFLLDFMLNLDCHKYFLKSLHQFFVYSWKHKEQFYFFIFRFYFSVKSPDLGMCIYLEILLCSPWKVKQKKCTL